MHRLQKCLFAASLLVVFQIVNMRPAAAWGADGHRYINRLAVNALPPTLRPLYAANVDWISIHSNDPDTFWRNQSKLEAPTHFIDLDTFGMPQAERFPRDYWMAAGMYGRDVIDKNGTVPWRIGNFYGLLVRAFRQKDSRAVVEISSWLGHYVADTHVPFHAAANYDGQLTGQKGIHARFETAMVSRQIKFEDLRTLTVRRINDPVGESFQWLKDSLHLVPAVLAADKAAVAADPSYQNTYFDQFGAQARPIAIRRLESGAQDLASLWYSAWQDAGKPDMAVMDVHAGETPGQPTHDPTLPATPAPAPAVKVAP